MRNVTLYTTDACPYCVRAKSLLTQKGISYTEHDVTGDDDKRRWLVDVTGRRTVPQIFFDDLPIGGYDDLHALVRQGRLDAMLQREKDSV